MITSLKFSTVLIANQIASKLESKLAINCCSQIMQSIVIYSYCVQLRTGSCTLDSSRFVLENLFQSVSLAIRDLKVYRPHRITELKIHSSVCSAAPVKIAPKTAGG